jgi:hypothetical protein
LQLPGSRIHNREANSIANALTHLCTAFVGN